MLGLKLHNVSKRGLSGSTLSRHKPRNFTPALTRHQRGEVHGIGMVPHSLHDIIGDRAPALHRRRDKTNSGASQVYCPPSRFLQPRCHAKYDPAECSYHVTLSRSYFRWPRPWLRHDMKDSSRSWPFVTGIDWTPMVYSSKGIHRCLVASPVMRKMFPCHNVVIKRPSTIRQSITASLNYENS